MITLSVNLNGDGALAGLEVEEIKGNMEVLVLDRGMSSGRPSVTIHFEHEGKHYVAQTSARLFCIAARAIQGRYEDLFEGD